MLSAPASADPLDPNAWAKHPEPVFEKDISGQAFGPGHNSFFTSPDGTEDWIVYHAKAYEKPGWERVIRAQPFTWNADGSPHFGSPDASLGAIDAPSGQCP